MILSYSEDVLMVIIFDSFLGFVPEGGVIAFYQKNPVDIFINVSASEGTPVTIMEAQSCGIPVIATAVGGNPEIVTPENGLLLPENPNPREIADGIFGMLTDPGTALEKRERSYKSWDERYNPEKNFPSFVTDLKNLVKNNITTQNIVSRKIS